MKKKKLFTTVVVPVLLVGSLLTPIPVLAENVSSEKEEVIYIMTDASGSVKDIEAVNIFSGGNITDYGDYTSVKMLNTTDTITQNGETITFSSDADKVYYQGTMKTREIPWNISIRYFLDGKEYTAEEMAGKSGAMEIHFSVSKNESCKGSFYEDYALQAAFTLDTDQCKNIIAEQATIANVGNNKQISYVILPGRGVDAVIKAEVTDFEMNAVTINGVRMNLNLTIDSEDLTEKVEEMVNAIDSIDNGASELSNGTEKLAGATGTLNSKVGELNSGVGMLAGGAGDLYTGLAGITEKNEQMTTAAYTAYVGLCNAAAVTLNNQLAGYGIEPITLTPTTYSTVLTALMEKLGSNAGQISELKGQLDQYGSFYQGLLNYTGAVSNAAAGANTLQQNMGTLYSNTEILQQSVGELDNAVGSLNAGARKLADGTAEFADKTSDMDTQINEEMESVTSSIGASEKETVSFVSDRNTSVDSLQFVIKTAAIEKAETEIGEEPEESSLSFWQKLLRLFGL